VIAGFRYEDERGLEGEPVYAYREGLERTTTTIRPGGGEFKNRFSTRRQAGGEEPALPAQWGRHAGGIVVLCGRAGRVPRDKAGT